METSTFTACPQPKSCPWLSSFPVSPTSTLYTECTLLLICHWNVHYLESFLKQRIGYNVGAGICFQKHQQKCAWVGTEQGLLFSRWNSTTTPEPENKVVWNRLCIPRMARRIWGLQTIHTRFLASGVITFRTFLNVISAVPD